MLKYIFYGNVRCKVLCELTERFVKKQGGEFLFYVDDGCVDGKKVFASNRIGDYPEAIVVIMISTPIKVIERIRKRGFKNKVCVAPLLGYRFIIEPYMNPEVYEDTISKWAFENKKELELLYELDDIYTKKLLNQRIMESGSFCLNYEEKYMGYIWEDYFSDEKVSPCGNITFVDCGAYIGDSLQSIKKIYGEKVKFSYLFEPDQRNFDCLKRFVIDTGLTKESKLVNKGCYDYCGSLNFTKVEDELEQKDNGEIKVPVVRLDEEISYVEGTLCIKMDLEGSECAAIRGAANIIKKYRPYMAICVYHRIRDILEIPRLINEIADGYRFYLRGGLHTEVYAVPK